MSASDQTTHEWATLLLPLQVKPATNKHYIQILDAAENPVCDFFPFAGKGGRGWDATMAIAEQIVEAMNAK